MKNTQEVLLYARGIAGNPPVIKNIEQELKWLKDEYNTRGNFITELLNLQSKTAFRIQLWHECLAEVERLRKL